MNPKESDTSTYLEDYSKSFCSIWDELIDWKKGVSLKMEEYLAYSKKKIARRFLMWQLEQVFTH